jgi:hypothetical protein
MTGLPDYTLLKKEPRITRMGTDIVFDLTGNSQATSDTSIDLWLFRGISEEAPVLGSGGGSASNTIAFSGVKYMMPGFSAHYGASV